MASGFPLTVELESGPKKFADASEVSSWLDEILAEYEWLDSSATAGPLLRNPLNKMAQQIRNNLNAAKQQADEGNSPDKHIATISQIIKALIQGDQRYFQKGSERLEFCKRLANDNPDLAAAALWVMLRPKSAPSYDAALQTRGYIAATLFDLGLTDTNQNFPKASDHLLAAAQSKLDDINARLIEGEQRIENFRSRSAKRRSQQRSKFKELLNETREDWRNLEKTYEQKLALNYSVTYWDRKAREYGRLSYFFGVGAVVAALGFAFAIGWWAVDLFEVIGQGGVTRWYQISIVAVYATIGIWILRILTRALMANMHLKVDAEQRVTMITTYLALLKEGRALEESDRRLIIEALFRPTQSGLIAGESQGQALIEQIAALLTRRSGS